MTDLSDTILAKSDQLNADDLISGPITIKVTKVSKVAGDQPVAVHYEGDEGKPFMPCKTVRRILIHAWGNFTEQWVGKSMTLYRDPTVIFGGQQVGGIRVSHLSHIPAAFTLSLTATKKSKKPVQIKPLVVAAEDPAYTKLRNDGQAAAAKGVEKFTEWGKGLSGDDRSKIESHLSAWLRDAKAVDAAKAPAEEEGPGA